MRVLAGPGKANSRYRADAAAHPSNEPDLQKATKTPILSTPIVSARLAGFVEDAQSGRDLTVNGGPTFRVGQPSAKRMTLCGLR